jgi:MYXO-CTERM domain-containing protein
MRTLWQFIIDPRAQRLSFTSADNSKLRTVNLKDFDFSCQSPVEVYDIGRVDAGDVRSAFVPYSYSFNAELVDTIFGIYKSAAIPTSDGLIERIKAFPDTTTCVDGAGGASGDAGRSSSGGAGTGAGSAAGASMGCSSGFGDTRPGQGFGLLLLGLGLAARSRARRLRSSAR